MDDANIGAQEFCSDLVRVRDEDRWLAARYGPGAAMRRLRALYALQCELRHIPAVVSEPPLGEIRLQWWRDAFDELRSGKNPRAYPVVEELAVTGLADKKYADSIDRVIDAAARPLYSEAFSDISDLTCWLENADGGFDGLAVQVLGGDNALAVTAVKAGGIFALAREGRRIAPGIVDQVTRHAEENWRLYSPQLKSAPPEIAPAVLHLSLTSLYLKKSDRWFPMAKRLKLFSAMAFGAF